jgi:hypothetical protein
MTLRFVMQIEDPGELRSPDSRGGCPYASISRQPFSV